MTKIGVFGDIHGNLEAFRAVLDVLDVESCDALVCTGDIVGYGPEPAACIQLVREREIPCVLGNHDHYVTLLMDPRLDRLRADVRKTIEWTQSVLSMDDLRWLAKLPQRLDFDLLSLVHGSFGPHPFNYLTNEATVGENFQHQDVPLAFCGHTHVPLMAFCPEDGPPSLSYLKAATLPDVPKVILNVGAVGQPRDHDPRAACGVFVAEERDLRVLRVPYDIGKTQERMRQVGLPEKFATRLELGR